MLITKLAPPSEQVSKKRHAYIHLGTQPSRETLSYLTPIFIICLAVLEAFRFLTFVAIMLLANIEDIALLNLTWYTSMMGTLFVLLIITSAVLEYRSKAKWFIVVAASIVGLVYLANIGIQWKLGHLVL